MSISDWFLKFIIFGLWKPLHLPPLFFFLSCQAIGREHLHTVEFIFVILFDFLISLRSGFTFYLLETDQDVYMQWMFMISVVYYIFETLNY